MSVLIYARPPAQLVATPGAVGRDPRRGWSRSSVSLVALVLWVIVFRIHVFVFKLCLE